MPCEANFHTEVRLDIPGRCDHGSQKGSHLEKVCLEQIIPCGPEILVLRNIILESLCCLLVDRSMPLLHLGIRGMAKQIEKFFSLELYSWISRGASRR